MRQLRRQKMDLGGARTFPFMKRLTMCAFISTPCLTAFALTNLHIFVVLGVMAGLYWLAVTEDQKRCR